MGAPGRAPGALAVDFWEMVGVLIPARRIDLQPIQVRRSRRLAAEGHVVVQLGQMVEPTQVVARGPGAVEPRIIDLASELEVPPREVVRYLQRRPGDALGLDQVLATRRGPLGMRPRVVRAPLAGVIREFFEPTGELILVPNNHGEELKALFPGRVVDVVSRWGVVVGFTCVRAEGLTGVGPTVSGPLVAIGDQPDHRLQADDLGPRVRFGVLLVGSLDADAVVASTHARVVGIVAGSVSRDEWERILRLASRPAVMLLEGFGDSGLSRFAWDGLRRYDGWSVILDASREHLETSWPELLIPVEAPAEATEADPLQLSAGALVRFCDPQGNPRLAEVLRVGQFPAPLASGHVHPWIEVLVDGRRQRVSQRAIELVGTTPVTSA